MTRKAGILMPVASLPNRFGAGDFGPDAYRFVKDIKKAGFTIWQILPLNPLGYGNSPYQPFSSYAMDELYISLDFLYEEGLIAKKPVSFNKNTKAIDYQAVRKFREPYLKEAFKNFKEPKDYEETLNLFWLEDYTVFIAFKKVNNLISWNEWKDVKQRNWPLKKNPDLSPYEEEINYQRFLQYVLLKQWKKLKTYANKNGIQIMGDIPFYVGVDSADCWGGRNNFLLNKNGKPRFIAGVPPDYFSADGQRWGNPIYDWEYMEKDGFSFWMDRLSYNRNLFDIIRLDHFRAFDTYWKIPASCPTARVGEWIEAPGYAFFDTMFAKMPDINIIAEDLGDLRPEVYTLRDHYNFAGMNVLDFTFNPDRDNYTAEHCLCYTGTHDNETLRYWYSTHTAKEKRKWRQWFKDRKYKGENVCEQFIDFAMKCNAETVIIPTADWLYLGKDGCLNRPGTIGSPNWEWRMPSFKKFEARIPYMKKEIKAGNRLAK